MPIIHFVYFSLFVTSILNYIELILGIVIFKVNLILLTFLEPFLIPLFPLFTIKIEDLNKKKFLIFNFL